MKQKRVLGIFLTLALFCSLLPPTAALAAGTPALSMLRTDGKRIVNAGGQQITLRGTNLGGWLMQEGWLSPMGAGEIDHRYIANVTATSTNGAQTANLAIDTINTNGIITNNLNTYWQSSTAQGPGNMELKLELDKPRTFSGIVVETDSAHRGDYLRGAQVWVSTNNADWRQVGSLKIDESQKDAGIIKIDTGEQTAKYIAIKPSHASENGQYWAVGNISLCMTDEYTVRNTLIRRFGEGRTNELVAAFQNNWITAQDIQNIANMNMNFVRVPVYWMNFALSDGTIRTDANSGFAKLDWLLEQCSSRGIYVLIDFHGAPGGSNGWASSGQAGTIPTSLFIGDAQTVAFNQATTLKIWSAIAARYRNNPCVAAYGLLNEPVLSFSADAHLDGTKYWFYNELYKTVRAADPDHIVVFEEFGDWSIAENRPERLTWTNYMFEKHPYDMANAQSWDSQKNLANSTVSTLSAVQNRWNVPLLVGEFCLYYFTDIWDDFLSDLNRNSLSWTNWCYKVRGTKFESGGGNWGYYNTFTGQEPDLLHDSVAAIQSKWTNVSTAGYFTANLPLIRTVSARANGSTNHPYVALNRSIWTATATSASSNPYNPTSHMLDGNLSTRWSTGLGQAAGQSVTIDMKAVENFDKIEMLCDGQDFPGYYQVETSRDGVNFARLELNNVDIGFGSKMVLMPSTPQSARYIRISLTGAKSSNWWSILELNVLWRNVNG